VVAKQSVVNVEPARHTHQRLLDLDCSVTRTVPRCAVDERLGAHPQFARIPSRYAEWT
jgi:hypothetical protein